MGSQRVGHDWASELNWIGTYLRKQLIFTGNCHLGRLCIGENSVVTQSLSHVWLFAAPWTVAHQVSLSFTISWSLLKLMSIKSAMPSKHLILFQPLLLLPSIFPINCVRSDPCYYFIAIEGKRKGKGRDGKSRGYLKLRHLFLLHFTEAGACDTLICPAPVND